MKKPPERVLRLGFVALLGGGILLFAQERKPRDLPLALDLTEALPGDVVEVDLVVRRDGHVLLRKVLETGKAGAPGTLRAVVRARPGDAEIETTLSYAQGPAHRSVTRVRLSEGAEARVAAR